MPASTSSIPINPPKPSSHEAFNDGLDGIDIVGTFFVFTEHTLAGLIRVIDAVGHMAHDVRNLLHILYQL